MPRPDTRPLAVAAVFLVATLAAPGVAAHQSDTDPSDGDVHVHQTVQHPLGHDGASLTCTIDGVDQAPADACSAKRDTERDIPSICLGSICLF